MTIYHASFTHPSIGNITNQAWVLEAGAPNSLRPIVRRNTRMFVTGANLRNGDFVAAWDTDGAGTNKGVWTQISKPNLSPPNDSTWFQLVTIAVWNPTDGYAAPFVVRRTVGGEERLYRTINIIAPAPANAAPPNASWTTLSPTAWNNTAAYSTVGTFVTYNNVLYSSIAAVSAIPQNNTPQATWTASMLAASGTARYNHTGAHVVVNDTAHTGSFPTNTSGTWRLQQVAVSPNAAPPNASWTTLNPTAHSQNAAYAVGDLVTSNNKLWSAIAEVSAPSGGTTYTQIFNFAAGGNTSTTGNVVDYLDNLSSFPAGVCLNNAHNLLVPTTGTFRLRRATGTTAETTGVTGTITKANAPHGGSGYFCFRVGSIAEMRAAFGTGVNITTGANWIFERVTTTTPTPNPLPENDSANWSEIVTSAWGSEVAYSQNAVVTYNNGYYRANVNIPAPHDARTIDGPLTVINHSGGNRDIRIGTEQQMRTAFGNVEIATGGNFELIKLTNGTPDTDTTNWSAPVVSTWSGTAAYLQNAIVIHNSVYYRANANIAATGNTPPESDPTNWARVTVTAWNANNAYSTGTIVTFGDPVQYWETLADVPGYNPITYNAYATWNNYNSSASPNNSSGTVGGSDYYAGSGASGGYRASLFVDISPLTTGTEYQSISTNNAPPGTYRLRFVGTGLAAGVPGFIVGTINLRQPDNGGRRALVVSPTEDTPANQTQRSQDMIDAFGTTTPSAGGTWILEKQN